MLFRSVFLSHIHVVYSVNDEEEMSGWMKRRNMQRDWRMRTKIGEGNRGGGGRGEGSGEGEEDACKEK